MRGIQQLLELMARLRDQETGCEWDLKQDFYSLRSYTIEEAYEVVDAVQRGDIADLRDELGDLLLQVIFYSQIAKEDGLFDFDEVVTGLFDKLIRRHPHVFENPAAYTDQERAQVWEKVKASERDAKTSEKSGRLDGIARSLPALIYASKIQQRAANAGFDWVETEPVIDKIHEELEEVKEAWRSGHQDAIEDEIGDLFFAIVNLARHTHVDAETALRRATVKFSKRFQYIEDQLEKNAQVMEETALDELDHLWDEAKLRELK